jgi:hypothetical protein
MPGDEGALWQKRWVEQGDWSVAKKSQIVLVREPLFWLESEYECVEINSAERRVP